MELAEALSADGLVCAVGAGGKKTTLYTLAARRRAVVTATVRIPRFEDRVRTLRVTADPVAAVESHANADGGWPLGLVPAVHDDVRYEGYPTDVVDELARAATHVGAEATLVKADGARNRLFKAPGDREPQIPAGTDTVVPIASARAVGSPLTEEHVHRPERVAAVAGTTVGADITPETSRARRAA
jgi:probable selenium-dependent hydroxylase accessory protein YqeC